MEVLPIRLLTDEDAPIFGVLSVCLGKLLRAGLPVAPGIVVTPPHLKLRSTLEHFDFVSKDLFRESWVLVAKDIKKIPIPQVLIQETGKHKKFLLDGKEIKDLKNLWFALLDKWLDQIKNRLWNNGFYPGITDNLEQAIVIFAKTPKALGSAYFDPLQDDVEIQALHGQIHPADKKSLVEIVTKSNKKLFLPYEYRWILDQGIKLCGITPYTPSTPLPINPVTSDIEKEPDRKLASAVKVFFDGSLGLTIEKNVDGVYIASEKVYDLNKPRESFDNLAFRVVESAISLPNTPILFKLADKSEGMGKVRGSLRLVHQKSLLTPLLEILDFARHKKGLLNVHIVIPFVRSVNELMQIKRELATYKLARRNSLKIWMEISVPENIVNLEDYLEAGIDGVVLNMDELIAYLNGFDHQEEELMFYKNEVLGLIKFLEDGIKLLHRSKTPFIACGSLSLYPKVLEYLVEQGVYGIVVEKYEAHSIRDLLYQTERRMILRRSS